MFDIKVEANQFSSILKMGENIYQFHTKQCLDLKRDVVFHEKLKKKLKKKSV